MRYKQALNPVLRLKLRISQVLDRVPLVYPLWRYLLWRLIGLPNESLVNDRTAVVIEGFPRSGNSFAYAAFLIAQPHKTAIAHHTHRPSQVIAGLKRNLPTLVLIRRPEDAVASLVIYNPFLSASLGLKSYINYYGRLEPYRGSFVLATFEEIITDFGQTIYKLNEKCGTSFSAFSHTEENVRACYRLIERWSEKDNGLYSERRVARPSPEREQLKVSLRSEFQRNTVRELLQEAQEMYSRYCQTNP